MLCPAHKISISHIWLPRKYRGREKDAKVSGSLILPVRDHMRAKYTPVRKSRETLQNAHKSILKTQMILLNYSHGHLLYSVTMQHMCPWN